MACRSTPLGVSRLAGCPGVGDDLGAVDEHVELLAHVNRMVGAVDGVEHLKHPRIDPFRIFPGEPNWAEWTFPQP